MRNAIVVFLAIILTACNTDNNITVPEMGPDACIVTASMTPDNPKEFSIPIYFGTNPVDDGAYNLGQDPLSEDQYRQERSVVIGQGEQAHLVIGNMGAAGITPIGNGSQLTYYYMSSWGYGPSTATRTIFEISRFDRYASNFVLEHVGLKTATKHSGERVPVVLPSDNRYTYFVQPREVKSFDCMSDVSYIFSAPSGITASVDNSLEGYGKNVFLLPVQPIKVSIKAYRTIDAAQAAIARLQFQP